MQVRWLGSGSPFLENFYIVFLIFEGELVKINFFEIEYKSKTDITHEKLYSLVGAFVKDDGMEQFSKKVNVFAFTLYFAQKSVKFYTIKKEEKDCWVKAIKEAIGYSNLYDYYTIGVSFFMHG